MPCADLRVLFATVAGPRRGFGHLVRCRSLARALGVRPLVAVRGGAATALRALALGCDVVPGASPSVVSRLRPDVLVVDDPSSRLARAWIAAGRRAGSLVVSLHDLGIGCLEADLVVDGSVTRAARARRGRTLAGPAYAVIDTALARRTPKAARGTRVLISLGGGPRTRRAAAIARAIRRVEPSARVRIAGGFLAPPRSQPRDGGPADGHVTWVHAARGLGDELRRADVAVLGGGVSLYEACAAGVPAVGVPVVRAQEPTVKALVSRRASAGVPVVGVPPAAVAAQVARLLQDGRLRRRMAATGRELVDGRGADRVAAAIGQMAARPPRGGRGPHV